MNLNENIIQLTSESNSQPEKATFTIEKPRFFVFTNKLKAIGLQVIIVSPVFLMVLIQYHLLYHSWFFFYATKAVLYIALGLLIYFLPSENLWADWVIRKVLGKEDRPPETYAVQITLTPRICGGIEGALEDADSIGLLTIAEDRMEFAGDAIHLSIPFSSIISLNFKASSWRWGFLGAKKIVISCYSDTQYTQVAIICREGYSLPANRAAGRRMIERLHRQMDDWMMKDSGIIPSKPSQPEHRFPLG